MNVYISRWTTRVDAVFVHISHEINNQQCLGKYGLSFLIFHFFWILRVYLPFLHRPITAMGDIFQWVVRFQPRRCSPFFPTFALAYLHCSAGGRKKRKKMNTLNLKCWQLNPKIYPRDFIDFWFNCVGLLNHVKATLSEPFTRGMKSAVSDLIGPPFMPLLCQCSPFAVWLLQGSNSVWLEWTAGFPHIMEGCKNVHKQQQQQKVGR